MQPNADGKTSPGSPFKPPAARIWNNMVDAGRAFADSQLNASAPGPVRPRETDIIKVKNDCGAVRRKGEILKIDGNAIETVADEHIWLVGKAVTADCYFGILKRPVEIDGVESVQVSGVCMALIDITDTAHTRANCAAGSYVLESSDSGPIEILYSPSGETGEQDCVVRFAGGGSSTDGSSTSSCPCTCIEEGDIEVEGVQTTSRWSLKMGTEVFKGTFGDITFPAGDYIVIWDVTEEKWVLDIGDVLTAAYHSGNDATADTTMDGTLEMTLVGPYGVPTISLCLDGEVPEEV